MNPMRVIGVVLVSWLLGTSAIFAAQAPVEDASKRQDPILQGQQKTGAAFRALQQAEYDVRQAQQDHQRAETEYKTAQKRADELQRLVEDARKSVEATKGREALARKAYDAAVNAVDQTSRKAGQK